MKVLIVQHASAVPKEENDERPLSDAGRADAERVGAFLAGHEVSVSRVLHSDRARARETAEIIAATIADGNTEEGADFGPEDSAKGLALKLAMEQNDVAFVGHMPFVGRLVSFLITDSMHASVVAYEPGAVVCLQRDVTGLWAIEWMVRPSLLAAGD